MKRLDSAAHGLDNLNAACPSCRPWALIHTPRLDQCDSTDLSNFSDQSDGTGCSDCTGMLQHKVASPQALNAWRPCVFSLLSHAP